ncbi:imidazolonepropionase [Flavobacteriaceae bacterium]|nr:imidazolonepropionase [Flavobacteriaceae bacterium]MDB9781241.1 imidazolonepropionase [Flavobacteriaceae bacterium]MDB9798953.1 imidazolonepropionase [Flavobacteriaceae bacterium]
MTTLFINIKELIQVRDKSVEKVSGKDMSILPTIKNAFMMIENEIIINFGPMEKLGNTKADSIIDVTGRLILPTWSDSHTHLVFADTREEEFVDRINGLSYEQIAQRGGGILNSATKLQNKPEEELYNDAAKRLEELIKSGTGSIEIKSGYGLTLESELKMLRVIKKLKENFPLPIKATFLGAHAIPNLFKEKREAYIKLIIDEMLPVIAAEKLADYIDVFCEKGYYTPEETNQILKAGLQYGLIPKIHVNQFNSIGGIKVGIENNALSLDHLEVLTNKDLAHLKDSDTIPVSLPSCSFFLGIPYTNARKIMEANVPLALASDYNPGSTPSGNMNFVVSLACIKMKMTPEEAINAATINGAYALNLSHKVGSISKGKLANFIITKPIKSYSYIPYSFTNNCIENIFLKGVKYY